MKRSDRGEGSPDRQARLAEFGLHAAEQADLDGLLKEAAEIAADTLGVEYVKILEYMPDERRLLVRAGVGWDEGVVGHATIGTDMESPAGYALQTGKPVISNELDKEERFRTPELLRRHNVTRAANVIIRSRDEIFGVFEADSRGDHDFVEDDLKFLQGYAGVLALAWTQNRLLRQNLELTQLKETLLRELQHRTKNNYQLITSLIQFQARRVTNIEARENLERICGRIQAMNSVQTQLYVSEKTDRIDLGNYLLGITSQLLTFHENPALHVRLETSVSRVEVPPDKAQTLGLILNEFLTNSLKHAFKEGTGTIALGLDCGNGQARLDLRDDGPGLPTDNRSAGVGLELIELLTNQLDGTITWVSEGGTQLLLEFPVR